ncbi:hypothetical protein DV737_g4694, partial [Chaetothyriales sp. CBS 132003]
MANDDLPYRHARSTFKDQRHGDVLDNPRKSHEKFQFSRRDEDSNDRKRMGRSSGSYAAATGAHLNTSDVEDDEDASEAEDKKHSGPTRHQAPAQAKSRHTRNDPDTESRRPSYMTSSDSKASAQHRSRRTNEETPRVAASHGQPYTYSVPRSAGLADVSNKQEKNSGSGKERHMPKPATPGSDRRSIRDWSVPP